MFSTLGLTVIFTLAGLAVGSFLNVCICRIPEGCSIVFPASRCPRCGHPIRVRDNIPLVSYFLLGGTCRDCGERISPRYPIVEAITAGFAGLLFGKYGLTPAYPVAFLFVCVLIVITFIDLEHQIIPHVLTLSGIPLFAVLAVLFFGLTPIDAFLGIMIGAGILHFVAVYFEALTGVEGMGGADPNLLAMLGGVLGWQSLLFILLVSSLLGSLVGGAFILWKGKDRRYPIPYGPFLCVAGVLYLFWGEHWEGLLFFFQG